MHINVKNVIFKLLYICYTNCYTTVLLLTECASIVQNEYNAINKFN